ncbi:hypothetical protein [Thiocapsa sp.]
MRHIEKKRLEPDLGAVRLGEVHEGEDAVGDMDTRDRAGLDVARER